MKKRKETPLSLARTESVLAILRDRPYLCSKQINAHLPRDCKDLNIHNINSHLKRMVEDGQLCTKKPHGRYRAYWLKEQPEPQDGDILEVNNRHFADEAYTHKRAYMRFYED